MKKIIVAGTGHGGISAALNLAKAGYDVTVYEKKARNELGYDWVDCMLKCTFENTGFPRPDESCFGPMADQAYFNPNKTVKIVVKDVGKNILGYMERKYLINWIIDSAEENGVKFVFETPVVRALYDSERVTGIRISENGVDKDIFGDMIIDAAGIDSPVRRSLPEEFGVRNEAFEDEVFCTWRGSFRKTGKFTAEPKNTIYFYHCGLRGMDWAINDEDSIDILIGGFGKLTDGDVAIALEDFKKDYPIEDKPCRGGYGDKIPLGRYLEVMVCNNYAAVGNSAFMTDPLSGSGIDASMQCGKILADTIIEANGDMSVSKLWKYNYRAVKEHAECHYGNVIVKGFMSVLTREDMDFFFEHKILTEKEIGGGANAGYTVKDIIQKASVISRVHLAPAIPGILKKVFAFEKMKTAIPEGYNKTAVENWKKVFEQSR